MYQAQISTSFPHFIFSRFSSMIFLYFPNSKENYVKFQWLYRVRWNEHTTKRRVPLDSWICCGVNCDRHTLDIQFCSLHFTLVVISYSCLNSLFSTWTVFIFASWIGATSAVWRPKPNYDGFSTIGLSLEQDTVIYSALSVTPRVGLWRLCWAHFYSCC